MEKDFITKLTKLIDDASNMSYGNIYFRGMKLCEEYPSYKDAMESIAPYKEIYNQALQFLSRGSLSQELIDMVTLQKEDLITRLYDMLFKEKKATISTLVAATKRVGYHTVGDSFKEVKKLVKKLKKAEKDGTADYQSPELIECRKKLFDRYNFIFSYFLIHETFNDGDNAEYLIKLMDTDVDTYRDAICLAVSGLMMSCLATFNFENWYVILKIFLHATDVYIKERAFVGMVLASLNVVPGCAYTVKIAYEKMVFNDPANRKRLAELQSLILLCLNTDEDAKKAEEEMYSQFLKSNEADRLMKDLGGDDYEENLDDILHSEEIDEKAEKIEESIQKLMDMERAGVDIYYLGFSKMKKFPFFHNFVSWFLPYSPFNPYLDNFVKSLGFKQKPLTNIKAYSPFCESDKYSLSFVFENILSNNRKESDALRMMLTEGRLFGEVPMLHDLDFTSPIYIRRMLLQDLYRFFRVSHFQEGFLDIFRDDEDHPAISLLMAHPVLGKYFEQDDVVGILRMLYKRKDYRHMSQIFALEPASEHEELQLLKGMVFLNYDGNPDKALPCLERVLASKPDSLPALKLKGKAYIIKKDYTSALEVYRKMEEIKPSEKQRMKIAYCLLNSGDCEAALKLLFELYYKHPDDINIMRPLAWGLTLRGDTKKAIEVYKKIMTTDGDQAEMEDLDRMGLAFWLNGDFDIATQTYMVQLNPHQSFDKLVDWSRKIAPYVEELGEERMSKLQLEMLNDAVCNEFVKTYNL